MNFKYAFAALLLASTATTAMAQTTGSQKFTVTVPSAISIVAPANVSLTHDETENNQAFPAQQWVVKGNSLAGVTVSFSTGSAFQHITDANAKRDASLGLAVNSSVGAAAWTVNQASDTTDYANNDGIATVQASSNGFGRANLDVSVSFITDEFGSFPAGDYETTVTGTVTAN
ncbi:MAG: hypothetical protein AB8B91_15765 [Rubripirellula sp.]